MAETAITAVLSKCGELATREAKVLLQVGDDIMLLRDRLEWMQAFVRDADRKRRVGTDDLTRVWVRQTRDVAFEAEDALDEFFHKVDLDIQGRQGWKLWLGHLNMNRMMVRHVLSSRIKKIKSRLDQISENQKEYNIDYAPSGICTSANMALVARDDLEKVVGFEKDVESLAGLLREDHPQKMFISILGESGIGKNTLVNEISGAVEDSFDIVVVYTMPPDCSMEDLLRQVYRIALDELNGQAGSKCCEEEEGMVDFDAKLHALLADRRYLLILGGISSKIILNCVAASLPDGKRGSWVVLTLEPENKEVASHAAKLNPKSINRTHQLSRLDEKRSGDLFRWRVFGAEGDKMKGSRVQAQVQGEKRKGVQAKEEEEQEQEEKDQEAKQMKRYEEDVYNITGGHPLAIVVLAGLLRTKERPVEWDTVLQHLMPGMEEEEEEEKKDGGVVLSRDKSAVEWLHQMMMSPARGAPKLSNRMAIERIFSSSFDALPQDLKSCFLYFAAYPKDVAHEANQIVRMWTAEGFIRPQKGKTMEQLGHSYLQELVSRCLVELEETDSCDGIRVVRVHNRLLMFLQAEAREASFIEVHDKNDVLAPASVRRLSIQDDSGSYIKFTNKFPKLRTFICRIEEQVQGGSSGSTAGQDKKQSQGSTAAGQDKKQSQGNNSGSDAGQVRKQTPGSSGSNAGQDKKEIPGSSSSGAGHDKKQSQSSREPYDVKFLCGSKFLRVLSMQGSNLTELPEEIGDMIHLRYLRVDCKHLKNLPPTIKKLLNLQTLDISDTNVEEIDQDFWLIKTLRHVLAKKLALPMLVENMEELGDLQTLHGVQLKQQEKDTQPSCGFSKRRKSTQYPLEMMTKLRSLDIYGFSHKDHATALTRALGKMHLLGHLKLAGDKIPLRVFTEPSLKRLQTMVLDGIAEWPELKAVDVIRNRPNLVSLKVNKITDELKILTEQKKMEPELVTLLSE